MLPEPLQQVDRTWARWRGETLAYFGGCDYFRMAWHPEVLAAAEEAIRKFGLNVAASRWTTGNHVLYEELEAALAQLLDAESALLTSNGYLTNLAVVQGLSQEFSHVLVDRLAHPSLQDAGVFAKVPLNYFRHRDPLALQQAIATLGEGARPLVLTDGVFAHDGSIAPLDDYLSILPKDGWMLVDDSHGAGTVGTKGRGVLELYRLKDSRLIQTLTLSKAFGCFGGAIASTSEIREKIERKSRALPGATPFPLPYAAAAIVSIRILANPEIRKQLNDNVARISPNKTSPIISVVGTEKERTGRALLGRGIFPSHIHYSGGPPEGFFRFAISSEHTRAQLEALAAALREIETKFTGPETAVGFAK